MNSGSGCLNACRGVDLGGDVEYGPIAEALTSDLEMYAYVQIGLVHEYAVSLLAFPSFFLFSVCLSVCPSVCPSICLCVCLSPCGLSSLFPTLPAGEMGEDSLNVLWASSVGWVLCTCLQVRGAICEFVFEMRG